MENELYLAEFTFRRGEYEQPFYHTVRAASPEHAREQVEQYLWTYYEEDYFEKPEDERVTCHPDCYQGRGVEPEWVPDPTTWDYNAGDVQVVFVSLKEITPEGLVTLLGLPEWPTP